MRLKKILDINVFRREDKYTVEQNSCGTLTVGCNDVLWECNNSEKQLVLALAIEVKALRNKLIKEKSE